MSVRSRLPNRRPSLTVPVQLMTATAVHEFDVTVGCEPSTGRLLEVFYADGQRSGADLRNTVEDACVLISLLLQHGAGLADVGRSLGQTPGIGGHRPTSIIGAIVEKLSELSCAKREGD